MMERQKDDYIDAFERENGVCLRKDHIKDNPTLRKIAKLILNSLWGGFMKNPHKKKVKDMLTNQNEFAIWINKDCFVEKNFEVLSKRVLLTIHRMQKEFVKHDGKGDMVHGIFTTALARLKLLREGLLKKNNRILYMDTDSIIFMDYPDDKLYVESIETRNVLGCWEDEIKPKKHPLVLLLAVDLRITV